ncbi:unnamed protein product [Closterium sp. NIES-54]
MPNKTRKQIGRAHSENGVYILDFSIPDCSGDSQELIDLVPLRFEHIHHRDWKHLDGRPWVPHHAHPHEVALHDPDLDSIYRDCHTPTASTSAIVGRGLAAIAEAEREAPPEEGLSNMELETATRVAFGTEENPLPRHASQHLRGMLRGTGQKSFANGVLRIRVAHSPGADEEKRRAPPMKGGGEAPPDGAQATPADGEQQLAARQANGALPAKTGALREEEEIEAKPPGRDTSAQLHRLPRSRAKPPTVLPARARNQPLRKLEKVYSDFLNVGHCEINDELYTLTFVDAGTRYVWVVNVEARSRAYEAFRLWLAHVQWQSGKKLDIWQSDGPAVFRSKEMQDYLAKKGIKHHVSLPYAHHQQGVAEHTNRTLMTKVRALMKQSKLPPTYLTYAMHHAVRVHNLLSTMAITANSSRHVKWSGTKGNTSMLRVWGCMVQYRSPMSTIGKFTSRAHWGIHLGISHEHKAWLILYLMSQKMKNACDVIFYEQLFLRQFHEDEQANANHVYANDGHSYASPQDEAAATIMEQDPRGKFTRGDHDEDNSPRGGAGAAGGGGSRSGRGATPPTPHEIESDDDEVQEVIPQHRHDSTVSGLQHLGLHTATSTAPRVIEPKNPRQALTGPDSKEWREAMDAEIKALESRDTWVLIDRATIKGRRILSGKWVFRVKTAADGTIERFKAH